MWLLKIFGQLFSLTILRCFSPLPNSQGFMLLALLYVKIYTANLSYALTSPSHKYKHHQCAIPKHNIVVLFSFASKALLEKPLIISLLLI